MLICVTHSGEVSGGPMYYLERGLGLRWLGICFAIFALCASFGIGNMVKPILLQMHFFNKLLILKTVFGLKTFGFHLAFGF